MASLFSDIPPAYPPGFSYREDFINPNEEQELLHLINGIKLHTFVFQGYEAKRRVASFGYDYSFESRELKKGADIPAGFQALVQRAATEFGFKAEDLAELLVTHYPVGAVINWHRDAPPFDVIIGVSLAADCVFRLRPHEKAKQVRGATIDVPVRRRSVYLISGEARSAWQHATKPVKADRYSITLRTLKGG